jgi:hypothetical protein
LSEDEAEEQEYQAFVTKYMEETSDKKPEVAATAKKPGDKR